MKVDSAVIGALIWGRKSFFIIKIICKAVKKLLKPWRILENGFVNCPALGRSFFVEDLSR
jgi:hypothetical protein